MIVIISYPWVAFSIKFSIIGNENIETKLKWLCTEYFYKNEKQYYVMKEK